MGESDKTSQGKPIEDVLTAAGNAAEAIDYFSMTQAPDGTDLIYVGQLGKDRVAAEAEIRKGVKDDRLVDALLAAWQAAQPPVVPGGSDTPPKPSEPGPVKVMTRDDPPPRGSVDVTTSKWPILTASFDSETVEFKIPDILKGGTTETGSVPFTDLQWTDWLHVAHLCNLTKAIRLDAVYLGTGSILPDKVALRWRPQPGSGFVDGVTPDNLPGGGLSTNVCFTAEEDSAFKQGVMAGSVTGGFWLVSATASASTKSTLASKSRKRRIYMSLKDVHPTCRLHMRECVEASEDFEAAVRTALHGGDEKAFIALLALVSKYGHAVPENVVLGGVYVFENTKSVEKWEQTRENELKSKLEINFKSAATSSGGTSESPGGPHGGTSASYDDASGDWMSQEHMAENMRSYPVGGNMNLRDPAKWRDTLVNPGDWRVILREGSLISVFDFLPSILKQNVDRVWTAGRNKAWGINPARQVNKLPGALDYSVPLFWTAAGIQQVTMVNPTAKLALLAKNGVVAQVPPYPAPEVVEATEGGGYRAGRQVFQTVPIELPTPERDAGTYWTHCDPAPLDMPDHMATDARAKEALWRFEYSGDCTIGDEPLYWLVTQDGASILAAFEDKHNQCSWAKLWPSAKRSDLPGSSPAAWVVYPADPTGLRGPDLAHTFLLWNPATGGFLGKPGVELSGDKAWVMPEHDVERVMSVSMAGGGGMVYTHYELKRWHTDRNEHSDGTETMKRTVLVKLKDGVKEVYNLPEAEFQQLWWDLKPGA